MKNLFSISLALLVLFSSIGMAKTTHFCMGNEMQSGFGFSPEHLDCGMGMDMNHEENDSDSDESPESCCKNITEQLQMDDDVQLKKNHFSLDLTFASAFVQVFLFSFELAEIEEPKFTQYNSPPLLKDYSVLFERFLI